MSSQKKRIGKAIKSKYFPEEHIDSFEKGLLLEFDKEKEDLKNKLKKEVRISSFFDKLNFDQKLIFYKLVIEI